MLPPLSFRNPTWHSTLGLTNPLERDQDMEERTHVASEFLGFGGESGTESLHMIFTDDQKAQPGDLVVLINPQGKVFATLGGGDGPFWWEEAQLRGLLQVLRVSRVTYR